MKKLFSTMIVCILCLSMFSVLAPRKTQASSTYQVVFTESGVSNSQYVWSVWLQGYGTEYSNGEGNNIYTITLDNVQSSPGLQFTVTPPSGFLVQNPSGSVPVPVPSPGYVQVNFAPPVQVSISANPLQGYAPLTVSFTSVVNGGFSPYSYSWSFGTGDTSSRANPSYTYESSGTFTVKLTVTDSQGNPGAAQASITVSPTSPPVSTGNLQVTVNSQSGSPIAGATVTMTSAPSGQSFESLTTGPSGQCTFNSVLVGSYSVSVTASGYQSGSGGATVSAGQTASITVTLSTTVLSPTTPFYLTAQIQCGPYVGCYPQYVAYDPQNGLLYVTIQNTNNVSVINPSSNAMIKSIPVGKSPQDIMYDTSNGNIYVCNMGYPQGITVISGATNSVVGTITLVNPYYVNPFCITLDPANNNIYVGATGPGLGEWGSVFVISTSSPPGNIVDTINLPYGGGNIDPTGIVFDSGNNLLYLLDGNYVYGINTQNQITQTITFPSNLGETTTTAGIVYDSMNGNLYVAFYPNTLGVIYPSLSTGEITLGVGTCPCYNVFDAETNEIFVTNVNPSSVSNIDASSGSITQTIQLPSNSFPEGIAWDSSNGNLYVVESNTNLLAVLSYTPASAFSASASAQPISGSAPLSVQFTGSASGGVSPYSYSWIFGDGGSSGQQSPSYTYQTYGTYTATLTVTDSQSNKATSSVAIAVWPTLEFSVLYGGSDYQVNIGVSSSIFAEVSSAAQASSANYPTVPVSTLANVFYLNDFLSSGSSSYPIYSLAILQNGQQVTDSTLETQILCDLLEYCYLLVSLGSTSQINSFQSMQQQWQQEYQNSAFMVKLGNALAQALNFITNLGGIFNDITSLYGATTSDQVQSVVNLVYDSIHGYQWLSSYSQYSSQQVNNIVNTLESNGLVQSQDYNPSSLYEQIITNPGEAAQAYTQIESNVFGTTLTSDASSILSSFLNGLPSQAEQGFSVGAAAGLYAYFGYQLTAQTSLSIGANSAIDNIVGPGVIGPAIAAAITQAYIMPMDVANVNQWEASGNVSTVYGQMYLGAFNLASLALNNNEFILSTASDLGDVYGMLDIQLFFYYVYQYQYTAGEIFGQNQLPGIESMANQALTNAQSWESILQQISVQVSALESIIDPQTISFNFIFPSPETFMPDIAPGSGFVLQVPDGLASGQLTIGGQSFNVTADEGWSSTFLNSYYLNDSQGNSYLILVTPPSGEFSLAVSSTTMANLTTFTLTSNNDTLTSEALLIEDTNQTTFDIFHDIAVTSFMPSKTIVSPGDNDSVTVTVANQGNYTETFSITVYANATIITSQNVTLTSGTSATITAMWDTTGFDVGNYTISAYIILASGETNVADNTFIGNTVQIIQANGGGGGRMPYMD